MPDQLEFPATLKQDFIKVSDLHKIWFGVENENGSTALLSLHGGPGSRSKPEYLEIYRSLDLKVVIFDQRGCGQSTPNGETKENTLSDLIADIERLREHLQISKWVVTGSSWGSTLALAYAEMHPEKVQGLFLRNIFLARKADEDWFLKIEGARKIFPDVWEKTIARYLEKRDIPVDELLAAIYKDLQSGTDEEQREAAATIRNWEGNIYKLEKIPEYTQAEELEASDIASSKIFMHYSQNNYFLSNNQLLKDAAKLKDIPVAILHGRYDILCPAEQAYLLHKALPDSFLEITNLDGHSLSNQSKTLSRYMLKELLTKV